MPPSHSQTNVIAARRGNSVSVVTKSRHYEDGLMDKKVVGDDGHSDECKVRKIIFRAEMQHRGLEHDENASSVCDCFKVARTNDSTTMTPSEKTRFSQVTK